MTQREALNILEMGHSAYLTGEAGTGKTYVLNIFIAWLRQHGIDPAITASTGIAATHIEGTTIHSWSGIGIRERVSSFELEQMEQKKLLWRRFESARVLIIDEISMLSGEFFNMVDQVCRHMKRNDMSFGGMQIVCSGDFFQLPPVAREGVRPSYAFESESWRQLSPVTCYLTQQFRHEDNTFHSILSAIRRGQVTGEVREKLRNRQGLSLAEERQITRLFTHNVDVDALNEEQLARLKGKEELFHMQTAGRKQYVEQLIRGCLAPERLRLKKDAEVMFVKNEQNFQYVNGTQGRIAGFERGYPVVRTRAGDTIRAFPVSWRREEDGKVLAEITQVPLRLAWAITVHKSQGMTLDEADIDLGRSFVPGQGYVALSRVRALTGLYLRALNETALLVDEYVASKDEAFRTHSSRAEARLAQVSPDTIRERQEKLIGLGGGSLHAVSPQEKGTSKKAVRVPTKERTLSLLQKGMRLEQAAKERNLTLGTIIGHAENLLKEGVPLDFSYLAPPEHIQKAVEIALASIEEGFDYLSPIKRDLDKQGYSLSFDKLRAIRLYFWSLKQK